MNIEILFKIVGVGLLTAIMGQILKQTGKDEIATISTLAGLIIVIIMVVNLFGDLFNSIKNIFNF